MMTAEQARLIRDSFPAISELSGPIGTLFYGRLFEFSLRGRHEGMAFVDLDDQFIALAERRTQSPDTPRDFG